jgi:D-aminopeptidase
VTSKSDNDNSRSARAQPRARELGLPLPGTPGPLNAITDVPGVEVGTATLIRGDAIRTGVTAILPRPRDKLLHPLWAGVFSLNGNGEMTGAHWIRDGGWFTGPITITNTFSVGLAHHATIRWMANAFPDTVRENDWLLPVAAETYDGWLNDIGGQHVSEPDVIAAIDAARPGPVPEGNVGGGTGMICYEFKGGTGTSSRRIEIDGAGFTVGALVQANHGLRDWLTVCGVRVGEKMQDNKIWAKETGSIIVIIATDAPLIPTQLERLARRASIGIGRGGTPSGNNSGDIFMAFSTANDPGPLPDKRRYTFDAIGNDALDPIFLAAVEAVEEAVLNALVAAETMTGKHGRRVEAIDHGALVKLAARSPQQTP